MTKKRPAPPEKPKRTPAAPSKATGIINKVVIAGGVLFFLCIAFYFLSGGPQQMAERYATQTAQAVAQAAQTSVQSDLDHRATGTVIALSTLITYTPSPTETSTVTFTPSPTITETLIPSITPTPAPLPTQPPQVTPLSPDVYYVIQLANARTCPDTACDSLGKFNAGEAIGIDGVVNSVVVNGSPTWYRTTYTGQTAYVHSSLVSRTAPTQPISPVVQPQQPISQPPASSATCPGFEYTCQQLTCAQAYACFNAGNQQLDGNNDGIPCNEQCR